VRLALRDLARYQARSGAALAAISLALGIDMAIIISSAADKAAAYLALAACRRGNIGALGDVPVLYLVITIAGVPAAAALAGWLLAGREPPAVGRQPLD
jgi:putative ABC transport system permease protein